MISLKKDYAHGFVHLKVTSNDDLWYLEQIIEPEDILRMKTERKIKLGDGKESNTKVIKKTITLSLTVESVELGEELDVLRIKGKTIEEHDDIPKGAYHSFSIRIDDDFSIQKTSWSSFLKNRLEEALQATQERIFIVLFDNEHLIIARTRNAGIDIISEVRGSSHKKLYEHNADNIFELINKELDTLQLQQEKIVFAGPSFWHKPLQDTLKQEYSKAGVLLDFHDISPSAVNKLLRRPEVEHVFAKQRMQQEIVFVDEALKALQQEMLAYGTDDVAIAVSSGAVRSLGVTANYLKQSKQQGIYAHVQQLLTSTEQMNGDIHFLYDEQASKQIDALGGMVGILRWKM